MTKRGLGTEHAKAFLDIILGVVIALPMSELAGMIIKLSNKTEPSPLLSILMLASALCFSAFYWLETRRFIEDQGAVERALLQAPDELKKQIPPGRAGGEFLSLERFAGSILLIALVAMILKFAEGGHFLPFVIANLLFWVLDLASNVEATRSYKSVGDVVNSGHFTEKFSAEQRWYNAHFRSCNFYDYSAVNAAFFLALLLLDYALASFSWYRVAAAVTLLVFTALRHLFWRPKID